ncbi:ANK_REP_REGION domain-containing protein [Chloropicon roscoffensis]|uniref:ANK_REP_REGION domain-containing protein n=1 Tax=Chloropicon roscoffensis TaxID=1461544 RepID=A0A7S3C8I3_9CHLO|mmetsp:Transcript_1313/g.4063  ORF Transcript_1313/g.4063 Transcript_1313/m.4063 type:complete len:224 (+) Transcript_1313:41-712(+)
MSADVMMKRQAELEAKYEAMWDGGKGSHHPDYDPSATGDDVVKASRETEELLNAIIKNDVKLVYKKIEEGADVNFVFGRAYSCAEGYTPLMSAAHRGRLECAKALLRAGADPNYVNGSGDLVLFWGIDGGVEMIKLLHEYGADLDAKSPKDWTPLSYAKACGKYGLAYEKGIYPEDVLKYYGAKTYGSGPPALGNRSPRESYNPEAEDFSRMRGSYQNEPQHP